MISQKKTFIECGIFKGLDDDALEDCIKGISLHMIKNYPQIIQHLFSQTINRLRNSNDAALAEARSRTEQLKILVQERTAELQNALTELKHTQQFRDRFLANMSHEIRTPMNAIVGLTNLLVHSPLNEQQKKYIQVIKKVVVT